jgi:hypothetical protein
LFVILKDRVNRGAHRLHAPRPETREGDRMSVRIVAILGLIAVLSTSACAASSSPMASDERSRPQESTASRAVAPAAPPPPGAAPAPKQAAGGGAAGNQADQLQQTVPNFDRMIIRTVTMTLAVGNVQEAFRQVEAVVGEQKGYLAGSQIRQDGDRMVATMTLRIPADPATYQATLERLRGLAERVVDEQAQAQDVTEEYVDIDARLRTLKASEENLLALLARAQRVEDNLQIQRELTNVRSQIEQIQGRKQSLERRADMATINLTIREAVTFVPRGWSPGATFEEAIRALGSALRGLAVFAIWLAVFSPIWGGFLLLGWLAIWLFIRLVRRTSRGSRTTRPVAAAASPTAPATPTA